MKRKVKLIAILALVFAIGACDDIPELPQNSVEEYSDIALNINPVLAGEYTRATDTAFESGDAISLFGYKGDTDNPTSWQTWLTNGWFTKGSNGFTPYQSYYWYKGEDKGHLIGIYPYNVDYTAEDFIANGITFNVSLDQSTHAGYTASDLMYAIATDITPSTENVTLEFNHLLSKLVVDIDNQSAKTIKNVYVTNVYSGATYSISDGYTTYTTNTDTIKAGKITNANNGFTDSYALIIPPQQAVIPSIAVTTTDNVLHTYSIKEPIDFNNGKVRHLKVTITKDSIIAEVDPTINDWSVDEDVEFSYSDNPNDNELEYLMMEINPNWDITVVNNYYVEYLGYYLGVKVDAADDMAYDLFYTTKERWDSMTEKERLMWLTECAKYSSAHLIYNIAYYKSIGIDVTARNFLLSGNFEQRFIPEDGEYIAFMMGFNDDGTVAYKYACSNYFTYTTPVTEEYLSWCGTWEITDGTNTNTIEITQSYPGYSYYVEGWEDIYGLPMVWYFDRYRNCVYIGCDAVGGTNVQFGNNIVDRVKLYGMTNFGNRIDYHPVAFGYMQEDNRVIIEPNTHNDQEGEYFTHLTYVYYVGDDMFYVTDPENRISFPATMTRIASAESAAKHQKPMIQELPTKRDIKPLGISYFGLLEL